MGPVAVRNHSAEVSKSVARVLLLEHDAARLEKLLAQPEAEFQVQPATIHSPAEIDSALNSREIAAVILDCTGAARGLDET